MESDVQNALLEQIHCLIIGYELDKARAILNSIVVESVPIKYRFTLASFARRTGMNKKALDFLQELVYGTNKPDSRVQIEYASVLRKLRMVKQSLLLLDRINGDSHIHLQKSFCHIAHWDYENAQRELEKYLSHKDTSTELTVVAKINLISCLIENQNYSEAHSRLDSLEKLSRETHPHIFLNCLENRGQLLIKTGQLDEAISVLNQAYRLTRKEKGRTTLFIEKWLLIAGYMKNRHSLNKSKKESFLSKVREISHWESLRDFQFHIAKIAGDSKELDLLFFGTPFWAFRERMQHTPLNKFCFWGTTQHQSKALVPLGRKNFNLPFGMGEHRLLLMFLSDLYHPWTIESLFDGLYQDEVYDPFTSPKKVYRLIERLSKRLKDNPYFDLMSTHRGYRIRLKPEACIRIDWRMQFSSQEELISFLVQGNSPEALKGISAQAIAEATPLNKQQAYRVLQKIQDHQIRSKNRSNTRAS